jgi:hypothetical protein
LSLASPPAFAILKMAHLMVPMEGNEHQDIQQWAAAQWEESDISSWALGKLIERPTSTRFSGVWSLNPNVPNISGDQSTPRDLSSPSHPGTPNKRNSDYYKQLVKVEFVSWEGPADPANPMNWSARKKAGLLSVLGVLTLLT